MADHPNKIAFAQGVEYIFKSWTALNLAVEQDWGGVESGEKRDWMMGVIVDYFGSNGKRLDIDDIEAILEQIMTDEFHILLEDDSAYLVAKHLVEMYHQCVRGDFSEVDRLRQKYQSRTPVAASTRQQANDDDDDSSSGEDNDDDMDMDEDDNEPRSRPEPEIDDDGFQTVSYKRK